MEWIPTTGLQKRLPSFRVNVFCRTNYNRRVMSCIDSSGEWDNYNFSYEDEKVIDWIDESESEPLYTEKDVIGVIEEIENYYTRVGPGEYVSNKDISKDPNQRDYLSSGEILDLYMKTRIPTKI